MFGTSSALQMDNILTPVRRSIACHSPRKHSNRRESLCPLKQHERFLQSLQLVLFLLKSKGIFMYIDFVNTLSTEIYSLTFATACTFWCKHAMIIVHAINFIIHVHCEWNAV